MAASISTWTCSKCTFINDEGSDEADKCMICQEPRKSSSAADDDASDTAIDDASDAAIRGSSCKIIRFSDDVKEGDSRKDSMSALGNMSFAAWESDRKSWTCKACTFVNEPRFLMCGACGMAEGSCDAVKDELIALGLRRMSLCSAHEFLMSAVHKQLDSDREDKLRHERAVELLKEQIAEDYVCTKVEEQLTAIEIAETNDQKPSSANAKARKHIETLERIQQAERGEHEEMLFTIDQWQMALREEPNEEQEQEMHKQEELLDRLLKEWEDRENELRQLRMRLEGDMASI
mmetsp:Transcript_38460/g.69318  ORF Transcript_38460/g.69318 Transcript_38460/m.69318 type:complete len:291 (+) Transcript_38460:94-966(+)